MKGRRPHIVVLVALLLAGLGVLASADRADACMCDYYDPERAWDKEAVVFMGQHVETTYRDMTVKGHQARQVRFKFEVESVWKGPLAETLYITSTSWVLPLTSVTSSCDGMPLGIERDPLWTYIIYADEYFEIHACSRVTRLKAPETTANVPNYRQLTDFDRQEAKEDFAFLGPWQTPTPGVVANAEVSPERTWLARAPVPARLLTPTPTPTPKPTPTPTPTPQNTATLQLAEASAIPTATPTSQDPATPPSSGGCGRAAGAADLAAFGALLGLAWCTARSRRHKRGASGK